MVKQTTSLKEFEEIVGNSTPTVVDFYADWCGPCKFIAPKFVEMAKEFEGKVNFLKVNVDEAQEIS